MTSLPGNNHEAEQALIRLLQERPQPFRVDPKIQPYVWGRPASDSFILSLLGQVPGSAENELRIAELWFGAHRKNPAMVRLAGAAMPLDAFAVLAGELLLGPGRKDFGQLFKVLDAAEPLSMQMHDRYKPDSKNECWAVVIDRERLAAGRDQLIAEMYLGFRPVAEIDEAVLPGFKAKYLAMKTDAERDTCFKQAYQEALEQGRTDKVGGRIKAFSNHIAVRWEQGQAELYLNGKKQGDDVKRKYGMDRDLLLMNVPGATVHALYYGVIYELQETADKTLRLYDSGRNDPNRPLHIAEALTKLDFQPRQPEDYLVEPAALDERTANLIRTPLYSMDEVRLRAVNGDPVAHEIRTNGSYHMLMVTQGEGELCCDSLGVPNLALRRGDTLVVPAALPAYRVLSPGRLTLLKAYEASPAQILEAQRMRGEKFWEKTGFFERNGLGGESVQ